MVSNKELLAIRATLEEVKQELLAQVPADKKHLFQAGAEVVIKDNGEAMLVSMSVYQANISYFDGKEVSNHSIY